jgi:hypothetical protein
MSVGALSDGLPDAMRPKASDGNGGLSSPQLGPFSFACGITPVVAHHGDILRYARSFPPGSAQNQHDALPCRFVPYSGARNDSAHTVEDFGDDR